MQTLSLREKHRIRVALRRERQLLRRDQDQVPKDVSAQRHEAECKAWRARFNELVLAVLAQKRRRDAELVGLCLTSWGYAAALSTRGLYW